MAKSASKPILGFGPIGSIALVILIALVVLAISNRDLQWDYLQLVGAIIGDGEVEHYLARFHMWHGLALLYQPGFNLVTMIPVIIALRIHPAPFGWWRYAVIVAWALFHPVYWIAKPLLGTIADWFEAWAPALTFSRSWTAAEGVLELASVVVLLIATRSWRLALVVAGLILGTTVVSVLLEQPGNMTTGSPLVVVVTWHLAVAAIVLNWAIRARVTHVEDGRCPTCGYYLTDLVSDRCPECGSVIDPGDRGPARHSACRKRSRNRSRCA